MEFQIDRDRFLYGVGLVSSVTAQKNNTLPILGNLLIEARPGNEIELVGTDLELGVSTFVPVEQLTEGSVTIPAKKTYEILRELPPGPVEVTVTKSNAVNIKGGKAFFKIMGLGKEDFPRLPEANPEEVVEIDPIIFKECLALTSFAISRDETRYVLNGVYIQLKGEEIKFVATDGRRLAFIRRKIANPHGKVFEMIIPSKATQELLKILDPEGVLRITPTKNQAIFQFGKTTLTTRLIEGHFPNYEQVIPKTEKTTSRVAREEFLQAIRRAALLTSSESQTVKFDFLKDKVLISSRTPNLGEAREEITADVSGEEVAIGFNPHYLVDVLKSLDTDTISLSLSEPDKPGLLRGKEDYLYVIMPMQLN